MSELDCLFLYSEQCILNVCVAPSQPFLSIPMVTASKKGEDRVFGKEALEKDETWELTWLQDGIGQSDMFQAFFLFVYQKPSVQKNARILLLPLSLYSIDTQMEKGLFWLIIGTHMHTNGNCQYMLLAKID
mmetsp:Transcript_8887/g.11575  ORF Transcript_8887/g.11575 Transcript_8887/m.11575 type:complete len:131 (-) Transcript_8887:163-555(-)